MDLSNKRCPAVRADRALVAVRKRMARNCPPVRVPGVDVLPGVPKPMLGLAEERVPREPFTKRFH